MLTNRGLERVLGDLAEMGFNAEWGVLSAGQFGAFHERERLWLLGSNIQATNTMRRDKEMGRDISRGWWQSEPIERHLVGAAKREPWVLGGCDGLAHRMDRLKSIGNGQYPTCHAEAWKRLAERMEAI